MLLIPYQKGAKVGRVCTSTASPPSSGSRSSLIVVRHLLSAISWGTSSLRHVTHRTASVQDVLRTTYWQSRCSSYSSFMVTVRRRNYSRQKLGHVLLCVLMFSVAWLRFFVGLIKNLQWGNISVMSTRKIGSGSMLCMYLSFLCRNSTEISCAMQ